MGEDVVVVVLRGGLFDEDDEECSSSSRMEMDWRSLKVMVYGASGSSVGPSTSGCKRCGIGRLCDGIKC